MDKYPDQSMINKLRYYKKKYGYDIPYEEFNTFRKHLLIIKKIHPHHDFIVTTDEDQIPYEKVEYYAQHYAVLKQGFKIKSFLKRLTKFDTTTTVTSGKSIVLEFS